MKRDKKQIERLMNKPRQIRNICVISHIDHGKTSFCDNLLAHAGIINPKEAGSKKITDNKDDEIERGITIDQTIVTFAYKKNTIKTDDTKKNCKEMH